MLGEAAVAVVATALFGELAGREGREFREGHAYRPIYELRIIGGMEERPKGFNHHFAIDGGLTEIPIFRAIGEVFLAQEYTDNACSLAFCEEGFIGAFEVDEGLSPEEMGIGIHLLIE
jgi:hypothetical protein